MSTIHLISHTHWDREWYLPFQVFRLKLVHLVDELLGILARDPDYRHFMLDGQTIVLDDYLQMRPERAEDIRRYVQSGRLLIGPWYVMPDEFLVSPEALLRNLLQGHRAACRFGLTMQVGYTPDPFGHIGQLPQILRGFGIDTAALWRGLADEPTELWWAAPDGSCVLLSFLRDTYANAAGLPVITVASDDPAACAALVAELIRRRDSLAAHSATGEILLMQGGDHVEPQPATPAAIAYLQDELGGDRLVHSTLPAYFAAVRSKIQAEHLPIPTVSGELRSSKHSPLLPNVLSTRMWIKQRNHVCQSLLEKWAEPFSAWASLLGVSGAASQALQDPAPILREAWRMLMECHPHDSICGCGIDQVHEEMRPRFDQVEQIAEQITRQSLAALGAAVDTQIPAGLPADNAAMAIIVFNPQSDQRSGVVRAALQLPGAEQYAILDECGQALPFRVVGSETTEIAYEVLDRDGLMKLFGIVQGGSTGGLNLVDLDFRREGSTVRIEAVLGEVSEPNYDALGRGMEALPQYLADPDISTFIAHAVAIVTTVEFLATDVPGHGYRTFWLTGSIPHADSGRPRPESGFSIENEFLLVEAGRADATLKVTDKRTGRCYPGLNLLVDGGDSGDEYNYSPPASDRPVSLGNTEPLAPVSVQMIADGVRQTLEFAYTLPIPAALAADRRSRAGEAPLSVHTAASLAPGSARVDVITELDNRSNDHRLRVHFPAPFAVTAADYDGHFQVVRRPVSPPVADATAVDSTGVDPTWAEQPRPEVPQRIWTDVSDGEAGLMVAARGLPEVEVRAQEAGGSEIALTLLRCIGWLSRDDFATRRGHAGPAIATPGAQEPGRHRFEYSIIPHAGDWLARGAYLEAYAFDAPLRALAVPLHTGDLPARASLVSSEPASFVISAVKTAEDGHGLIVRGYNIESRPTDVRLAPWLRFGVAARVRLDEQGGVPLVVAPDGSVTFPARLHEIVTVKFE
jgi:mannosylglycerate hydrolase